MPNQENQLYLAGYLDTVTQDLDRVQTDIDDARYLFPGHQAFETRLDLTQAAVNEKRAAVKRLK